MSIPLISLAIRLLFQTLVSIRWRTLTWPAMDVSLQSDDHFFRIYQSHHIKITFLHQILTLALQDLSDGPQQTMLYVRENSMEALRVERQLWF